MEIMATSKNYGKKKVRITSGIFWTLMGKNLIMEKSDAGAAYLSWTFFFSIILSVTIIIVNSDGYPLVNVYKKRMGKSPICYG